MSVNTDKPQINQQEQNLDNRPVPISA